MKNKLFDGKLYLESLRRTSIIGGLFTVLLTVASLLVFFSYSTRVHYYYITSSGRWGPIDIDFLQLNPYIFITPFTLTPLLCLNLFGFLNKRPASDFWHSTPFTRPCIYNTFSLVTITWAVIAVVVPLAVSLVCFAFVSDIYAISWDSTLPIMLSVLAANLLVLAAGNLAVSLTGTTFSNVILATLILFLPRLFIMYFAHMATNSTLIAFNIEDTIFDPTYNIVAGTVLGLGRFAEMITSYKSICYTAILAVGYYSLGLWLFCRRRSESAGNSTTSRYMQAAIRIVVCLVACLLPIYLATDYLNRVEYNLTHNTFDWFTVLVLYVVAVAVYFIYELISTKKASNMAKAIPGLLIVALLNVLIIGAAHITYRSEYDYTPTAENVEEIRLYDIDGQSYNNQYFNKATKKIAISDDEIEQILAGAFSNTRTFYETYDHNYSGDVQLKVGFRTNGVYRYRNISMKQTAYNMLLDRLYTHESYRKIFDIENIAGKIRKNQMHFNFPFYGEDSSIPYNAIMAAYIDDVKNMDFNVWQQIISNAHTDIVGINFAGQYRRFGKIAATISGTILLDGEEVSITLPISTFTPKAYNLVMELIAADQEEQNAQQELLDALNEIDMEGYLIKDKYYERLYIELFNGEKMLRPEEYSVESGYSLALLIDILESAKGTYPAANQRLAIVNYTTLIKEGSNINQNEYEHHTAIFRIPDDASLGFLLGGYFVPQ